MTLLEFLRQWQPSRLTAGVMASVLLHVALILAILWSRPVDLKSVQKRGDALFVEMPKPAESPPPGPPGPAAAPPPAPRPAPPPVARPEPAKSVAKPVPPAPRREAERRVAAAPTPAPQTPDPTPAPRVAEPSPAEAGSQGGPQVAAVVPGRSAGPPAPDLRSLGRGGGAGGRGLDRGGIEGEPVALDTKDPKYIDYFELIRPRIKAMWDYPCVKRGVACERHTTELQVVFGVAKNGRLVFVNVLHPSPVNRVYDDAAVIAIQLASPFPPVPDYMLQGNGIPISVRFIYVLDRGFVNVLR